MWCKFGHVTTRNLAPTNPSYSTEWKGNQILKEKRRCSERTFVCVCLCLGEGRVRLEARALHVPPVYDQRLQNGHLSLENGNQSRERESARESE